MASQNVRERTLEIEQQVLSPKAALCMNTKGRRFSEADDNVRTAYQRDRDRIIHCNAFLRLKQKTQVFLSPEGDHYRTRLTHTLEVAQIARTIARGLRLNEDLTEAIALGHDLGHTPFGHAGERALNAVHPGGFFHHEQSLRVVDHIEKNGKGLNLTYEVRNGILCHTHGLEAKTLEGRVVRLSDRIAYLNHDIEDAIRAGVLKAEDLPEDVVAVLGDTKSARINTLVVDAINVSDDDIRLSPSVQSALDDLRTFMFANVYNNPACKNQEEKVIETIEKLYHYYVKNTDSLPEEYKVIAKKEGAQRAACDHVASMSDDFALRMYHELFIPRGWQTL